jgi:putative ABC transport system permease protein
MDRMHSGEGALVSEAVASRTGLEVGDSFSLDLAGAKLQPKVAGVIRSYRTKGGVVYLSRPWFEERTGVSRWSGVRVFFPGAGSEAKARAFRSRLLQENNLAASLEITLGTELRSVILSIFQDTFAVTTVLLTIALLVAALGITTTLAVIILERTGDIATLSAIGAQASQIGSLVFWEAGYLVSCGIAAGYACGFILSAILVFVVNKVSFGWTFVYSVDWLELALAVPLAFAAAALAALPVLRFIRRVPPALALRQE